jgi:hypothetical protein
MKRSVGITISAVTVFLCSGAALFVAASSVIVLSFDSQAFQPSMKYVEYFTGISMFGFAAWGIASGVGLLSLRSWARTSMIVFSVFLASSSLPLLMAMLFTTVLSPIRVPPSVENADSINQTFASIRLFMSVFGGIAVLLGTFWLWFFNRRSIKEQFGGAIRPHEDRRPISVSIIGWYLVTSALFFPMTFVAPIPTFFLWVYLTGWSATLFVSLLFVLHVVMGVGLLKLKPWAWITSISYFTLFLASAFAMMLIPRARARIDQMQAEIAVRTFGDSSGVFAATRNHTLWGLVFALLCLGLPLWFLIRNKRAFEPTPEPL